MFHIQAVGNNKRALRNIYGLYSLYMARYQVLVFVQVPVCYIYGLYVCYICGLYIQKRAHIHNFFVNTYRERPPRYYLYIFIYI